MLGVRKGSLLSIALGVALSALPSAAQQERVYTQMETEDLILFLDLDGVAVRVEKQWLCRRAEWARTAEPLVFDPGGFRRFKEERQARNDWVNQWSCEVQPGPVTYSRDLQNAQRAMNAVPEKPDCAPWVPESGRLNWEMLDYARCHLRGDVNGARLRYDAAVTARLGELLREDGSDPAGLRVRARKTELRRPREGCGKTLRTRHDFVLCELDSYDRILTQAEGYFANYEQRIDGLRGAAAITQDQASGIAQDAELVREVLRRAEREAHGI